MTVRVLGFALWVAAFIAWLHFFASRGFWWGALGTVLFLVGGLVWTRITGRAAS
jgi:hypothetical protein